MLEMLGVEGELPWTGRHLASPDSVEMEKKCPNPTDRFFKDTELGENIADFLSDPYTGYMVICAYMLLQTIISSSMFFVTTTYRCYKSYFGIV